MVGRGNTFVVRLGLCALLAAASIGGVPRARADEPLFGAQGQKIISGRVALELQLGGGRSQETMHDVSVEVAPSIMYFFARNLAVGAELEGRYGDYQLQVLPYTELEAGLSLGFGPNVALGERWSFFPQLWAGAGYTRFRYELIARPQAFAEVDAGDGSSVATFNNAHTAVRLVLPLQVVIGPATYVALGPEARMRISFGDGFNKIFIGLSASVGGFF